MNGPSPFSRQLDVELRRLRDQVRAGWTDVVRDADLRTRAGGALVLRRIGPKRLLVGVGGLALLLFLFLPTGGTTDPFDGPAGAIDLFLKLGIVVALAYASLALLKRYTVGAPRPTSLLEVLESTTLAPDRAVYVVRAGERRLVLGVTQTHISTLAELEPADAAPAPHASDQLAEAVSSGADAPEASVRMGPEHHPGNGRPSSRSTDAGRAANGHVHTVRYAVEPPYGTP